MVSKNRTERRKAERAEERRRAEETDRLLEERPPAPFEAPATGKIVEPPKKPPDKAP